jgi:hypothetical protein
LLNALRGLEPVTFAIIYAIAACGTWLTSRSIIPRTEHTLWRIISFALIALSIHKLVEIKLTSMGRMLAVDQGWYGQRQLLQVGVIVGLIVLSILVTIILLVALRRAAASSWLALLGIAMLVTFALVRDISFHQVDQIINDRLLGLKFKSLLEAGGIGMVVLASIWRI